MMNRLTPLILVLLFEAALAQPPVELRAVKITNVDSDVLNSNRSIAKAMDYLRKIGINTILTVVWNGSGATGDCTIYPSMLMDSLFGIPIHPAFLNRDPLERVLIEAHRNGMEVLPWFEMGFATSYSQNGGHILAKFPEWALHDTSGQLVVKNGFDWMSAVNPEVQDFIRSLTLEVVDHYDVDGIEYSDRIPAMPVEGGYDPVTVEIYRTEHEGNSPPVNFRDSQWKIWRANKLTAFFGSVYEAVKNRSPHLLVSSSPSIYPWSYHEYLQNSKTWVESGIVDHIIPQLYRYSYSEYLYELNRSLSNFPNNRDIYFSGMLISVGDFLIPPDYLLDALAANRERNVAGEAYFFYEGLRAEDDLRGDTLKATYYNEKAVPPHRGDNLWRPEANIINEDEPGVIRTGDWQTATIEGYQPGILVNSTSSYASLDYQIDVPFEAWFDVYAYIVTGPLTAKQAHYSVYGGEDSLITIIDQTSMYHEGWQRLGAVYLMPGIQHLVKLDNRLRTGTEKLTADAVMIMINRRLSPGVVVTGLEQKIAEYPLTGTRSILAQNYPNPFNASTWITFQIHQAGHVSLSVFDIAGRRVTTLLDEWQTPGPRQVLFDGTLLASGVYYYVLRQVNRQEVKKMVVVK